MKAEIQYFNSQDAAKILGVNVSTIKRWTDESKLSCIKTAGGHRKFLPEHIDEFIKRNKRSASKVNLFPLDSRGDVDLGYHIVKGNFAYLRRELLEKAVQGRRDLVQQMFNGLYLSQYPLYQIYDLLVTPVLHYLGELWSKGELNAIEEHFASHTIRDALVRLQGILRIPREKQGRVLCLNPSTELHDIALKMIDHILELRGFHVLYSGQLTPTIGLDDILLRLKPDRVYISSTIALPFEEIQTEINEIYRLCLDNGIKVYVGGSGFSQINYRHPAVARRLDTFEDIFIN